MRNGRELFLAVLTVLLLESGASAYPGGGTLLVADDGTGLLAVDPGTGDRTVLSDGSTGSGPLVDRIVDAAIDRDGTFVGADIDLDALLRVDAVTGDRTIVASAVVGSGGPFEPTGVAILADRTILATDASAGILYSVDPATGDRTVVSSGSVGTGTAFVGAGSIAVESSSSVLVADLSRIVRVDLATGNRTVVSSAGVGSGPALSLARGLIRDADGSFLATDTSLAAVLRIDPLTGDRTVVSSGSVGTGAAFSHPSDVWPAPGGSTLYVVDLLDVSIVSVDVATGDRTILSNAVTGSGPSLAIPRSFVAVPTPRLVRGFEGETTGAPPSGVFGTGSVTVEDTGDFAPAIPPIEGIQVVYMTTGPDANGVGPDVDQTGDGNVESDRAELGLVVDRGPNDAALLGVNLAVLTSETTGGNADPFSLGVDTSAPPFLLQFSLVSANGSYALFPVPFADGPFSGPDGSSFSEGWSNWAIAFVPVEVGAQLIYLDVADEIDDLGDTALLVDNVHFVPEPAEILALAAGGVLLAGLRRRRAAGGAPPLGSGPRIG